MDPTTKAILEMVNSFYSTAWNQLVVFTTVLLAFVGIFIPVVTQLYQNRITKLERKEIQNTLQEEVDKIKDDLHREMQKNLEAERIETRSLISEMESRLVKENLHTTASLMHVQAYAYEKQGNKLAALESYVRAAMQYIDIKVDQVNLNRVLTNIAVDCLPSLSKRDIDLLPGIEEDMESLIAKLKAEGIYLDQMRKIVWEWNRAKERVPAP